jgi:hypothetical protein
VDRVAAYVGLLHSEAEHTLERMLSMLLENACLKSAHFQPDPVLVNFCVYYGSELNNKLGKLDLVPKRAQLAKDAGRLIDVWTNLGGERFFRSAIDANHGAGIKYVERLFHPVGVVINRKTFGRFQAVGVAEVADLGSTATTMVTEFVVLRGAAVHAGTTRFRDDIKNESPQAIATRGQGVVEFINETARLLAARAW